MDTPGKRLRWARERAGYATASEAARAFGWPTSTYLGHENGDRSPSRIAARRYARAFHVRWEWILEGEGSPTGRALKTHAAGYVGAGAEVRPFEQGLGDEVELPPGAPAETQAVIVRGDSMWPRYFDGERIFYLPERRGVDELVGRECVVKLRDERMLVKIVRRGRRKGFYTLESWNAPPLEDQTLEWAAPVRWRG